MGFVVSVAQATRSLECLERLREQQPYHSESWYEVERRVIGARGLLQKAERYEERARTVADLQTSFEIPWRKPPTEP